MILDGFKHTSGPAPLESLGQSALEHDDGHQRERIERGAHAGDNEQDGEFLAGPGEIATALEEASFPEDAPELYGDGHAATRIAEALYTLTRA